MFLLTTLSIAASLALAVLMGYAIQRGATCTVAAVDELLYKQRARRLGAMLLASLWVVAGLRLFYEWGWLPQIPSGYALSVQTVLGGGLLGLGAWLNGACVFGAIARLGSGQLAYLLTPVGFFIGAWGFVSLGLPAPEKLTAPSALWQTPVLLLLPVLAMLLYWLADIWRTQRRANVDHPKLTANVTEHLWAPATATTVIGISFAAMLVLAGGAWAYTDLLLEAARGVVADWGWRLVLLIALLLGSAWGGHSKGRFSWQGISLAGALRCLAGGALMGLGSALIPGSNDGLVLLGLPLLWPYAWVAFATMCLTIALAMFVRQRMGRT